MTIHEYGKTFFNVKFIGENCKRMTSNLRKAMLYCL